MERNTMDNINIAVVVSEFNQEITSKLLEGAITELAASGVNPENVKTFNVPGCVEIPYMTQQLAKSKRYSAIIALGAVIRGETDHYDYVCQQVSYGCQRVMLDYEVPVIFGVLTTHKMQQALDRVGGAHGHKGIYCAKAALQMIEIRGQFTIGFC